MKITWIGHACFKVEKDGYKVILDPYSDGSVPGLENMRECANKVLCSHGHGDHAGVEAVELIEDDREIFTIETLETYHDDAKGALRGDNKIHILKFEGKKVAHLGDIGCELTKEQQEVLQEVDVMMLPIGGHYTIDAKQAAEIIKQCQPKIAIPMHYRSDEHGFGYDVIGTVEEFVREMENVEKTDVCEYEVKDTIEHKVIILNPKMA